MGGVPLAIHCQRRSPSSHRQSLCGVTLGGNIMGKIRRGNYIFVSWIGDHGHHVHVFRDRKLIVKWDLDNATEIEGKATRRIRELIEGLEKEGQL